MHATSHAISFTTDTNGDATAYTSTDVNGRVFQVQYVKDDVEDGSTITLTGATTGVPIFAITDMDASATHQVRRVATTSAGTSGVGVVGKSGSDVSITDTDAFDDAVVGLYVNCDFADDDHADGRYEIKSVSGNDVIVIDLAFVSGTENVAWSFATEELEYECVVLAGERIKCVVSDGGSKKNGALAIITG